MIQEPNPSYTLNPQFGFLTDQTDQDWTLKLHCNECIKVPHPPTLRYKQGETCLECVFIGLLQEGKKRVKKIEFENNVYAPVEDVRLLTILAEFYQKWSKITDQIPLCQKSICFLNTSPNFSALIVQLIKQKNTKELKLCPRCRKKLNGLLKNYKKTELHSLFSKIPQNNSWLDILFIGPYSKTHNLNPSLTHSEENTLSSYRIPSFPLYTVTIYSNTTYESNIKITTQFGNKSSEFYSAIVSNLGEKISPPKFDHLLPVGVVLEKYVNYIENYLKLNYHNLDLEEIYNLALYTSVKKLNINKLFPLLVDSLIDEIYLDNPQKNIYVDHRDFGRCIAFISLTSHDISSIQTFLRISSNKRLDPSNPTIKCAIHNQFFHCRFAVDISPVVLSGFSLDIRKMNRKIFTIPELISRGMLSSQIAAFLYLCVLLGLNITTVGETNTGKTTLINSLDLLAPSHFRKIYIEESSESLDQEFSPSHQLKYQVDPSYTNSSKIQEIYRLLHRNPDLVYLGEILTKEEAHAMFHCLSAGLRGFQTIHARDINSLLNRWRYHFNIDPACYNDLDVIVLLKRFSTKRYIAEIVEISFTEKKTVCHPIFQFDPETSTWSNVPKLEHLHCFRKLLLPKTAFQLMYDQFDFYNTVFTSLSNDEEWDVSQQVHYFQSLYNQIESMKVNDVKINWNKLNHGSGAN